jgi:hypothetical protein
MRRLLSVLSVGAILLTLAVSTGAIRVLTDRFGITSTSPEGHGVVWSPPTPGTVTLHSCSAINAEQVTKIIGVSVRLMPASTASVCDFGPSVSRPQDVLVSIRFGLDDKATRASHYNSLMEGWTYPKDAPAPDGSGRRMGTALTVAVVTDGWSPRRSRDELEVMAISIGTHLVRAS